MTGASGSHRRASSTALLFATNLPQIVVGIFVSGFVGMFAGAAATAWMGAEDGEPYPWWWFSGGVVVWILCGLLLLRPAGERWLVRRMLRWAPVELDEELSGHVAAEVASATGMDLRQFDFYRTNDADSLNAMAIGGRTVAMTSLFLDIWASEDGIPDRAEAFVAHELGHHAGQHVRLGAMVVWLRAPAARFGEMWRNAQKDASGVLIRWGLCFVAVVVGLALAVNRPLLLTAVLAVVAAFVLLRYLSARASQAAEFRADEFAAACGYARPLAEFLSATIELDMDGVEDRTRFEDLFGSHPSMEDRIENLLPYFADDAGAK